MAFKRIVTNTLARADVAINGDRPWDIQVRKARFFRRTARGSVGLGESYIDGDWEVASLDALFRRLIHSDTHHSLLASIGRFFLKWRSRFSNLQTKKRSMAVAQEPASKTLLLRTVR